MRPPRSVLVGALVFALVYVALDVNKLWALRYGADTGSFLQFLVNEAHGRGSFNHGEYRYHLQVHDSWTLLALVPLVALFPYAQTLLIVQVIAVAAAALPIAALARACGATVRAASAVGLAYLISPSAQGLAYGNFIENVFVPLFAAAGALAVRVRSLPFSLLCAQLLLGLKEDQALFLIWFGAACALWWDRRIGLWIVALAVVNGGAFVVAEWLHGAHSASPEYALYVRDPLPKLEFFVAVLAPFAFLPLRLGWRLLLGAPLAAELVFSAPWAYQITRIGTHWTASVVVATALAAAVAIARVPRAAPVVLCFAVLCALTINDTVLKLGRWPFIVDRAAYARAVALRTQTSYVHLPRPQEGVWAVSAANPNVALDLYHPGEAGYCPGFNTNARAFFASLGWGRWPDDTTLCGGVAVATTSGERRR
jgi:uncharacterized membrane protein